jgi:hypothetical protein
MRQTSIDCYNQIKKEGLLPKMRFKTYEVMLKIAPCTASEVQREMGFYDGGRDCMKRIPELRKSGVVYEKGTRICKVTGRNVIEWDLTDKLPIKIKAVKSAKKQRTETAINALRELYKNRSIAGSREWTNLANLIKEI